MTAKQTWIVEMPEGWKPGTCVCDKCFGNCLRTDVCPLDNAKKAVEGQPGTIISLTTKDAGPGKLDLVHKVNGKPVTLYAVEMEDIK